MSILGPLQGLNSADCFSTSSFCCTTSLSNVLASEYRRNDLAPSFGIIPSLSDENKTAYVAQVDATSESQLSLSSSDVSIIFCLVIVVVRAASIAVVIASDRLLLS